MIELFQQWDKELFLFLNSMHSEWLDIIMWHVSGKLQWIPLYLLLLYLLIKRYGKSSWIIIVSIGFLIALSDQVSVKLFKEMFERYRPCHNFEIKEFVHLVNNKCGGRFGFVSSHATNSFALASFIGMFLSYQRKKTAIYLLLIWASIVSYSRIYLGVHYPSDVFFGGLLGISLAYPCYRIAMAFVLRKELNG